MNESPAMRRSEIRMVDFSVPRGAEAAHRRPAVIVSNDGANRTASSLGRGVVTVVPITSNLVRVYPFQVELPAYVCGLPHDSKAQAEQVRAVAVQCIDFRIGRVPAEYMDRIDDALRLHLDL
jgi:mRNA interferase MazF